MSSISPSVAACRYTNDRQPVNCLPIELLTTIFCLAKDLEDAKRRIPLILKLSHVCSRWYNICTSIPLLWSTVTISGGMECVREILRRSQSIPLDVRIQNARYGGRLNGFVLGEGQWCLIPLFLDECLDRIAKNPHMSARQVRLVSS